MIFTDIRLQNYRSYDDSSFELSPGVNIVVGPNAVGKTNLLEALMLISVGKSFRAKDKYLIKNSQNWLRLDAHTANNQTRVVKVRELNIDKVEKVFEFESKSYKKINSNYFHPVVLFQPDDLQLIYEQPSIRRSYLDSLVEQYTPNYEKMLNNYSRVITQRNTLLKSSNFSMQQLFAWDVRLADIGSYIIARRLELLNKINQYLSQTYTSICGKKTDLEIAYQSKTNLENYSDNLMKDLAVNIELDRLRGYTSRGPHRDDVIIFRNNLPFQLSASRGENRTLVLALKIIELRILEEETGKRPLLLLDDVFSELDGSRRKSLTKYLKDYQTLITTTDADIIAKNFTKTTNVILL